MLDRLFFFRNNNFTAHFTILNVFFVLRTDVRSSRPDAVRAGILGLGNVLASDAAHHNWIRADGRVLSVDLSSVNAGVLFRDKVINIGSDVDRHHKSIGSTAADFVSCVIMARLVFEPC